MPRRNSSKKVIKVVAPIDNDDIELESDAAQLSRDVRRTKSYPEDLLRSSMNPRINLLSVPTTTGALVEDNGQCSGESGNESDNEHLSLAPPSPARSKNYKRLKSCGQLQSALVTMAIRDGDAIQLWRLLARKDVDINEMDGAGMKPVHYACLFGQLEMLKILLQHDAELNPITKDGKSPLDVAVREGNFEIAQYLVKRGAQIKSIVNGMMDKEERRKTYSGNERKHSNLYSFSNEV